MYALDEETGCVRWTFRAPAEVRTAVIVESPSAAGKHAGSPLVFFGDLLARVYAVDAFTGAAALVVQSRRSPQRDDHGRARAARRHAVRAGVFARSHVRRGPGLRVLHLPRFRAGARRLQRHESLEGLHHPDRAARSGPHARRHRILAPSGAPVWNSPAIDAQRGVLYVGTGENYSSPANDTSDALIAFRLKDGAMVWHAQKTANDAWNVACMLPDNPNCPRENGPDVDFGASTIVLRDGSAATCCWRARSPGGSTASTRTRAARSSGAARSGAVASRAACTSAWPPTASGCSCRSRT